VLTMVDSDLDSQQGALGKLGYIGAIYTADYSWKKRCAGSGAGCWGKCMIHGDRLSRYTVTNTIIERVSGSVSALK
jgi:hypothetical protein